MKWFLIPTLSIAFVSLVAAVILLCSPRHTEGKLTAAAILGGLSAYSVMFALCLGYFMV